MTPTTKQEYMESFKQVVEDLQLCSETENGEVLTNNPIVVVHGRKPWLITHIFPQDFILIYNLYYIIKVP